IDPRGKVIGKHEGELQFEPFDRLIGEMVTEFEAAGVLDRRALGLPGQEPAPPTPLLFPGKLLADEASGRLFVTDTGHHRMIEAGVLYVAMAGTHQLWAMVLGSDRIGPHTGTGREALEDGPRQQAAMNQPSGLTTDGVRLYVADSEASAIRMVEPAAEGVIRTIVGEGLFEFGDRDG